MNRVFLSRIYGLEGVERPKESFPFGIEEEFFLAEIGSGRMSARTPDRLFADARAATAGRIDREFLRSQIEVAIPPYCNFAEARAEIHYVRRVLAAFAAEHELAILACGTHPGAKWREAVQSEKDRYDLVMDSLQMIGQRNMLCGMHVHVQLPNPDRRIDVMRRLLPYLPLLLALSTSSPFWQSRPTGLKGYRLAAYDELPRTGIPELFSDAAQYQAYVDSLVQAGVMPNASHIW